MLSDYRIKELKKFLKTLGINSKNYELIDKALTHSSFTFENNLDSALNYERLEFLGDSVLRLIISDILYTRHEDYQEGQLTKIRSILVSDEFIAKLALELKFDDFLNLGEHEIKTGGKQRESILACAFEAVLGALYEDGKLIEIYPFLQKLYEPKIYEIESNLCIYNAKALLQEYTQEQTKTLPVYEITNETGKAHEKTYEVTVFYEGKKLGIGVGKSKKEAEKNAALEACEALKLIVGGKCQR